MTITLASTSTSTGAGLAPRFGARLVDAAVLAATGLAVGAVTGFGYGWFAFQLVLVAGYLVGLDVLTGATLGKSLFGLRVVAGAGDRRPSVGEACRREAFVVLGAVPFVGPVLGPLAWAAIGWSVHTSETGEGAHDRWAGTRVIATR